MSYDTIDDSSSRFVLKDTSSVSESIIEEIANHRGIEPTELEPLYHTLDPDALDTLISTLRDRDGNGKLVFSYSGYEVMVYSGTHVVIRDCTNSTV